MNAPLIKICGIQEREHAEVAAAAGANMVGFVFYPVRRQIAPDSAASIIGNVRQQFERPPAAVGLFVNEAPERVNEIVRHVGLDLVQLSGDEPPDVAGHIQVPVIKAIRMAVGMSIDDAHATIQRYLEACTAVLIDSHVSGKWGGTGVVGDWESASQFARDYPVVLAGGLNAANVGDAIERVRPAAVDVSSGVESDDRKDPAKIREFVKQAISLQRDIEPASSAASFIDLVTGIQHSRAGSRI